jgi:glutamyl/glutaminyl-tRNA synthetase
MISRIAPTPSGFLHLGNALNFVITWLEVRKAGGKLRLRIDDLDPLRCRTEYLDDIFETLEWMKLPWDLGPRSTEDHRLHYSQDLRRERYLEAVRFLLDRELAFVCNCSRLSLKAKPCRCRLERYAFNPKSSVVRVSGSEGKIELGDFPIWRREGIPAYQMVSLLDDLDHGVDCIVRGEDLRPSTEAQIYLASLFGSAFGADRFSKVRFIHHPLIRGTGGRKLSKSDRADGLRNRAPKDGNAEGLYRELSQAIGLPALARSLEEMLFISGGSREDSHR